MPVVAVLGFYAHFEFVSNRIKGDAENKGHTANAVKHAYAAAELYDFFRHFVREDRAESAVLWLGMTNEYAERIVKFRNPDSFMEVLKDYHNNLAGVAAMQWRLKYAPDTDMPALLLKMADDHILVVERDKNPFYKTKPPVRNFMAMTDKWLDEHKEGIKVRVEGRLKTSGYRLDASNP